ncbi:MAG: hypothetical protein JO329_26235 [Planctomycetaceae bacterium]|nr:hypothetical protein [Planctomycetaceae bacterium]MBV8605844.1 hypothetical protein [Singulisphaera sp.]
MASSLPPPYPGDREPPAAAPAWLRALAGPGPEAEVLQRGPRAPRAARG